jgi:SAM-dependent methyltransferase
MDNFKLYSKCYDLIYEDKDYEAEGNYVICSLKNFKSSLTSILSLGSGTGRHDEIFNRLGYKTLGIELSDKMVEIACSKGLNSTVGDMTNFQLEKKFDAVVSLFHVVSYLNSNEKIDKMFKCVSEHLVNTGIFLFDVWFTPAVYTQKPEKRIKNCENEFLQLLRTATPTIDYLNNVVSVKYELDVFDKISNERSSFTELHSMRHFSVSELEMIAQDNGLSLKKCEEFLTGNILSDSTWGACFVFQKDAK